MKELWKHSSFCFSERSKDILKGHPAIMAEEEKLLDAENKAMRPYYDNDGLRALASAICISAMKTYRLCAPGSYGRKSLEEFFDSDFFYAATGIDLPAHEITKRILSTPNKIFEQHMNEAPYDGGGRIL